MEAPVGARGLPVEGSPGPRRLRRAAITAAALGALGFLAAMALWGQAPEDRQRVAFEPAGLMRETPEEIDRIELLVPPRRLVFLRTGGRWTTASPPGNEPRAGATPSTTPSGAHLDMSLRFMHATAPVRVMARADYAGEPLRDFGLDPPAFTVSLHRGARTAITARFGGPTPQAVLQYVQVEGRDELYLLPVFVGREWELVSRGAPP